MIMSLLQKAYETYNYHKSLVGLINDGQSPLLPTSHILKNVELEISINLNGKFVSARALAKRSKDLGVTFEQPTIIPVTIESGSRSGKNPAAHPLSDKLAYLIKSDDSKYQEYIDLLSSWEKSAYGDEKLSAVKKYVESGTIVQNLAESQVLSLEKDDELENAKINGVAALQCTVRWRVFGSEVEECWRDQNLFEKWADYYSSLMQCDKNFTKDICMISGNKEILAPMVPKGIVKKNANAKLISSNDTANFVYRGRFVEPEQASSVGYIAFQKVFVILQWLANNLQTSFEVADRTFLCWNPKGKKVPVPKCNINLLGGKTKNIFKSSDYHEELKKTFLGFKNNLPDDEDVIIAAFDAATTGRLAVVYYNELKASDFLERINSWYSSCYWYFYKNIQAPTIYDIVRYAYGVQREKDKDAFIEVDDRVLKQHVQVLFKCLIEKLPIPYNIIKNLTLKISQPQGYSRNNWEKGLSVACAVIRKYYNDKALKEEFIMSLDKNNCDRSYLFGRLLAVMEKVERDTYDSNEDREPTAVRLQSAYCSNPFRMMSVIHGRLEPYFRQLKPKSRSFYKNIISEIMDKLADIDESALKKALEPAYLLGYYNQRLDLYTSQKDKQEEEE